jgi:lipopolysaccharide/colanic/teichoic acid biosynthesis glycosyltransferase
MSVNSQFTSRSLSPETLSSRKPRSPLNRRRIHSWLKRCGDVAFSLSVLILFAPFYLVIAALIAVTSDGPIFYVQERVGKDFRHFGCIKFRTMVVDADRQIAALLAASPELQSEFEANFKLKQDPRITAVGSFLRVTFWNVLMGDMSVVGPRPLVPEELSRYGEAIEKVLTIRPGITGLWQVSGRNDIPYPQRVRMDSFYAGSRNLALDMVIIVRTIGVVLFPKNNGAY